LAKIFGDPIIDSTLPEADTGAMIFKQLFDPASSTCTYVVGSEATREAVLIDPVLEQLERDLDVLNEHGRRLKYTLDTHVHAAALIGAGLVFAGARNICGMSLLLSRMSWNRRRFT
jgi:glyoxylase-like metal-dependent hydrolase (beta-lactamase superfamily II)